MFTNHPDSAIRRPQEYEKLLAVMLPACNAALGGRPRACGAAPPRVRGSTCIVDMRGVGLGSVIKSRRLLTLFVHLDASYYPGGGCGGASTCMDLGLMIGHGRAACLHERLLGAKEGALPGSSVYAKLLEGPAQPWPPGDTPCRCTSSLCPLHKHRTRLPWRSCLCPADPPSLPIPCPAAETMDSLIFLGAPAWFNGALGAYRAALSPEFQARIEVIPGDFRPRLLELVAPENLLVRHPPVPPRWQAARRRPCPASRGFGGGVAGPAHACKREGSEPAAAANTGLAPPLCVARAAGRVWWHVPGQPVGR